LSANEENSGSCEIHQSSGKRESLKNYAVQIIVPCFNEEVRLPREAFLRFLKDEREVHLLFADGGMAVRNHLSYLCGFLGREPKMLPVAW